MKANLSTMFWGDDGKYIVLQQDGMYHNAYGPFHNNFVASEWARDAFPEERCYTMRIQPPFETRV